MQAAQIVDDLNDVLKTLTQLTQPDEVLALRPSPALQSQIDALIEKQRSVGLTAAEKNAWEHYIMVEHLVRMAKAKAVAKLKSE